MEWIILIRRWKHSTSPFSTALWDELVELLLLGGRHMGIKQFFSTLFLPSLASHQKSLVMQRSLAVISAWPGIQATQNLVSGNNTRWITPGWWKQESLIWQDSTCFALNSQCWNNDGISQGNTRGSKGVLWLWKRIAAQGAVTSFLFRNGLLCLLFIW